MTADNIVMLAKAWIRYCQAFEAEGEEESFRHPDVGADDEVRRMMIGTDRGFGPDRIVDASEDVAWRLLLKLVEVAPDDLLSAVSAGPFENWINDDRAARYRRPLAERIEADPRFEAMVRAAHDLPAVVHELIVQKAKEPRKG